ncbi:hypothetical protein JCM5350_000278 [Sporobolomyces pararoseus]
MCSRKLICLQPVQQQPHRLISRIQNMSNYHHYTTRARSNHTWEPEEQGERTETSYTSNWRRRGGGGNQQTNSYRGDRNDRTSGYSEFQPLRNRREALPDQSTSWRSSSTTTTQGQGGWGTRKNNHNNNRGGGEESSIWSTGEYKPISSSRRGSKSPSPPPHSQSGWTTPERRQKLHQRSTPLPTPSPAYLEAASSSTSSSSTNDEPPILVLDLNHTLLCRSERNRAGSKIPLVRPYLSTFLEYISSPPSTSSSTDSQRVQRFLPIVFSSARYRNVLSLLSALNLIPPEKLPPPYDPRQQQQQQQPPEVKGPYSEVYVCNREEEGDVLRLVWTRENMGLSDRDFRGDVETCKNLEGVWKALKLGQSPPSSQSIEGEEQVEEVEEVEMEKKRNLEGARRTILLDDEISKAAQQPYSLLPIKPFILTRKDFPILPSFQQKYPNEPPPPPFALELPHSDHPAWGDKSLLKVVFELDWIREQWSRKGKNIAYEIKNGGFEKMREEVKKDLEEEERGGEEVGEKEIEQEMEKRGEEICRKAGIQVRREWDKGWRERVLEKFR